MAYVNATTQQSIGSGFMNRIAQTMITLGEKMAREQVKRETYRELCALSDRELGDLGLARGNLRHIAHEAAYGDK